MSQSPVVFHKPFEVIQFWCSDNYQVHQTQNDPYLVDFVIDEPKPGQWFFQISFGPGTQFVGDILKPFLPTRKNISLLNFGCARAAAILDDYRTSGELKVPKESVFAGIEPYQGVVSRDLRDARYRTDLFAVLEKDWGIRMPLLERLGRDEIVLSYRDGLPCGAAMIRAIKPVLYELRGELTQVQQSTYKNRGGRMVDVIEYRDPRSNSLTQNFDITDFYGKDLPYENFDFSQQVPPTSGGADDGGDADLPVMEEMKGILGLWYSSVSRGLDPRELASLLFRRDFIVDLPDRPFNDPIEFCDFLYFARTETMLSDDEILELSLHAHKLGLDVSRTPRIQYLRAAFEPQKKWWQFWKS